MPFAVVVCGPPHSGKSVFVQQLRRHLLPLGGCAVIEGCPDGEGGWANVTDLGLVAELRCKGKFTPEFVDWVISSIIQSPMPLALVDVGGVRSPENERIFAACDGFIVIANPAKEGELAAWEEFGKEYGCEPIALLDSVLDGETLLEPAEGVIRGVQAGLERGETVDGPVIEAIVRRLLEITGLEIQPGQLEASVSTIALANELGIPEKSRDARLGIRPWHACEIIAGVDGLSEPVRLWGPGPGWVSALVACTTSCELYDVRLGYVPIPDLELAESGSDHLAWEIRECEGSSLVSFSIPDGVFDASDLATVSPPVAKDGLVVLSGRGPHWLTAAIARAYARAGHPVAVLSLHETTLLQKDGSGWSEAHPGKAPAVVVTPGTDVGRTIAIVCA